MVAVLLLIVLLISTPAQLEKTPQKCLTGYMTDVQSWVDERGSLTDKVDLENSLDLSTEHNPNQILSSVGFRGHFGYIKYLSVARCGFTRVPSFLDAAVGRENRLISDTIEYLSMYGNNFLEVSPTGEAYTVEMNATGAKEMMKGGLQSEVSDSPIWSHGLIGISFRVLKELDLRACGIETITGSFFRGMQKLEALYLGENAIHLIEDTAFVGLHNLIHLDISMNFGYDSNGLSKSLVMESEVFVPLKNLRSLDFSYTRMNQRNVAALKSLGKTLERLSLCYVGPIRFGEYFLKSTSLKILDVSGNHNILSSFNTLHGLESTLEVLFAMEIGLTNFDYFENFRKLEILRVSRNEIATIRKNTVKTLERLKVLDLSYNRLVSWFEPVFSSLPTLQLLQIMNNNINVISEDMMTDFANVTYLGLSGNPLVCNCRAKDLIVTAAKNELRVTPNAIKPTTDLDGKFSYHTGFDDVNRILTMRKNISFICETGCDGYINGRVLFFDYKSGNYACFLMGEGKSVLFMEVTGCNEERKSANIENNLAKGKNKLLLLLVLPGILMVLMMGFLFRRNLRYFYVTLRNSAMLSMVNKNKIIISDDTVFNYDVFVSYCNEDREWVLDQLLSHLEHDCSVSLCLHERDFQVGLSILENIVSCMDRSKFIMLVISQQFLLSQWCQFEMHLAQHRLLETRREDLILILLEEIPRRLRPNNLHYLMLTKTYIVWPKNKSEQHLFWKRLKKSVIAQKQKRQEKVTLT